MTTTSPSSSRPLRRDAARNRRALLDAGREVFAARGLDATLDEVARAAGVGVGTAYRHFANKQELAAAIFSDDFDQLVESANSALSIEDPWEALVTFIETTVAKHANDRGLYEIMMDTGSIGEESTHSHRKIETMRDALIGPVTALVEHAKQAGCLRADSAPTDVAAILLMMGSTYAPSEAVGRPLWRRYLWLLLDGLRATSCPKLPVTGLKVDELDAALSAAEKHKRH